MADELSERVAKLEEKVEGYDKRLDKLEDKDEVQTRLVTLMEIQTENIKELNNQNKTNQETLIKMNNNLDSLNSRVGKLEEDKESQQEYGKINIMSDVIKPAIISVLLVIIYLMINNGTGLNIK